MILTLEYADLTTSIFPIIRLTARLSNTLEGGISASGGAYGKYQFIEGDVS